MGNAQTDDFSKDIGITLTQVNTGQTLFTLGMVLLELPSNIIAKFFGPHRWIPVIMLAWGIITLSQAFIKNVSGFYATRFLLAAGEAGFIPGMAWYITRWYKNSELSLRFAIFWSSNSIGENLRASYSCLVLKLTEPSWDVFWTVGSGHHVRHERQERLARLAISFPHRSVLPALQYTSQPVVSDLTGL